MLVDGRGAGKGPVVRKWLITTQSRAALLQLSLLQLPKLGPVRIQFQTGSVLLLHCLNRIADGLLAEHGKKFQVVFISLNQGNSLGADTLVRAGEVRQVVANLALGLHKTVSRGLATLP